MRLIHRPSVVERLIDRLRSGRAKLADEVSARAIQIDPSADHAALARTVLAGFLQQPCLVAAHEWGIWPSSDNWFLFDTLSKYWFGRTHRIETMAFDADERAEAQTMLQIALQSGWGAVLFVGDDEWFYFDHDGQALVSPNEIASDIGNVRGVRLV